MIIVRVELHSAITGKSVELARMDICNDGTGSETKGNYTALTFRGRTKERLNKRTVSKGTNITNWNRHQYHVWNLICKALLKMGYTHGH